VLADFATSHPGISVSTIVPLVRSKPAWFHDNCALICETFKQLSSNLKQVNLRSLSPFSYRRVELESDCVRLKSRIVYVNHLGTECLRQMNPDYASYDFISGDEPKSTTNYITVVNVLTSQQTSTPTLSAGGSMSISDKLLKHSYERPWNLSHLS